MRFFVFILLITLSTHLLSPPTAQAKECPNLGDLSKNIVGHPKKTTREFFLEQDYVKTLKKNYPSLFDALPKELTATALPDSWLAEDPSLVWLTEALNAETTWMKNKTHLQHSDLYRVHVDFIKEQLEVFEHHTKSKHKSMMGAMLKLTDSYRKKLDFSLRDLEMAQYDFPKISHHDQINRIWMITSGLEGELKALMGLPQLSDINFKLTDKMFGPILNKPARAFHERVAHDIPKRIDAFTKDMNRFKISCKALYYQITHQQGEQLAPADFLKKWVETKDFDALIISERKIYITEIKNHAKPITYEEFISHRNSNGTTKKSMQNQMDELVELRKIAGHHYYTQEPSFEIAYYFNQPVDDRVKELLAKNQIKLIDPVLYTVKPVQTSHTSPPATEH